LGGRCGSQGCQIILGTIYQNGGKYTRWPINIPKGHKIYQISVKYTKRTHNIPTFSIAKPSKIYLKRVENMPSANPGGAEEE
jgi:hypothetical protein